ncbi:MAG TPA: hypothetical protein VE548_00170 [Nitrososphaeraceae archaeon]|nr:hypothetical protein [Nitrososphaeraceae archaeon]
MVFLAVSYFLMIGEIWDLPAEAGTGPGCNHKDGAAAIVDPKCCEYLHTINNTTANSISNQRV